MLPKYPLEPLLLENKINLNVKIIYGGEEDWVDKTGAYLIKEKYKDRF